MTKTIVIGAKEEKPKQLKPIELKYLLTANLDVVETGIPFATFDYVELICKKYDKEHDLIFAYNNPESRSGVLYLGYWNDGVAQ